MDKENNEIQAAFNRGYIMAMIDSLQKRLDRLIETIKQNEKELKMRKRT